MKVFACALALCLIAAVYGQAATGAGAPAVNPMAAAAAAAAASGRPMVGAGGLGGLSQLLTYGALSGGIGNDAFMRYSMCNMLTGGASNFLCLSSMMQ